MDRRVRPDLRHLEPQLRHARAVRCSAVDARHPEVAEQCAAERMRCPAIRRRLPRQAAVELDCHGCPALLVGHFGPIHTPARAVAAPGPRVAPGRRLEGGDPRAPNKSHLPMSTDPSSSHRSRLLSLLLDSKPRATLDFMVKSRAGTGRSYHPVTSCRDLYRGVMIGCAPSWSVEYSKIFPAASTSQSEPSGAFAIATAVRPRASIHRSPIQCWTALPLAPADLQVSIHASPSDPTAMRVPHPGTMSKPLPFHRRTASMGSWEMNHGTPSGDTPI